MGTTLVVAVWRGSELLVGHVGDSRAYCLRRSALAGSPQGITQLLRLTEDHSTEVPGGNSLTRALGTDEETTLEWHRHPLHPTDVVMLCSDGLSDCVGAQALERSLLLAADLSRGPEQALAQGVDQLIALALKAGGPDNISVILARRETP